MDRRVIQSELLQKIVTQYKSTTDIIFRLNDIDESLDEESDHDLFIDMFMLKCEGFVKYEISNTLDSKIICNIEPTHQGIHFAEPNKYLKADNSVMVVFDKDMIRSILNESINKSQLPQEEQSRLKKAIDTLQDEGLRKIINQVPGILNKVDFSLIKDLLLP